jgi:hypothetical protein
MATGDYAFLTVTKNAAVMASVFVGIGGLIYVFVKRPLPPLILKRMSELPPAEAEASHRCEIEPLLPGYRPY